MITAASLKSYTVKDLAQMAKEKGVPGWHAMRKEQLVKALVRTAQPKKAKTKKQLTEKLSASQSGRPRAAEAGKGKARAAEPTSAAKTSAAKKTGSRAKSSSQAKAKVKSPQVMRRIQSAHAERERQKDLAGGGGEPLGGNVPAPAGHGQTNGHANGAAEKKDRVVLLVRDPYWLQVYWEVTRQSVVRARAAMAEHWHTARPNLRVSQVEVGNTTSTSEQVVRDIEIHGGVKNWYIDVQDSPRSYRVDIGYLAANGRFFALARSNSVTTPRPGSCDSLDANWTEVAQDYERIYALSGGYEAGANGELQELFEERLRRPMNPNGSPFYGPGMDRLLGREREFCFEVDAEVVIYGTTQADARVTLGGEPVKVQPDGTFTVRLNLPDRRQVIPVVATSGDGVEQRTIVLAVERNTKVMEPVIRDADD